MPECDLLADCPFVNGRMKKAAATAESLKRTYCLGSFTSCACYIVAKELGKAPDSMFPHQIDKAREIVQKARALKKRKRAAAQAACAAPPPSTAAQEAPPPAP